MRTFKVEYSFDGQKQTAQCEEKGNNNETEYVLTPENKDILKKFGTTTFRQKEGEFLTGAPINDLEYFSALKEGLENHLYQKND